MAIELITRRDLEKEAKADARYYSKVRGLRFRCIDWGIYPYSGGITLVVKHEYLDRASGGSEVVTRNIAM